MELIHLNSQQIKENQEWITHFERNYGFRFLEPSYTEVPHASQFFVTEQIIDIVEGIEDYLLEIYPIDMGTNVHIDMNIIRRTFSKEEYEWHQKHNKLGVNSWGTQAGIGLSILNNMLNRDDLCALEHFPTGEEYDVMLFEQKLRVINSLDNGLYNILKKLHKDYK